MFYHHPIIDFLNKFLKPSIDFISSIENDSLHSSIQVTVSGPTKALWQSKSKSFTFSAFSLAYVVFREETKCQRGYYQGTNNISAIKDINFVNSKSKINEVVPSLVVENAQKLNRHIRGLTAELSYAASRQGLLYKALEALKVYNDATPTPPTLIKEASGKAERQITEADTQLIGSLESMKITDPQLIESMQKVGLKKSVELISAKLETLKTLKNTTEEKNNNSETKLRSIGFVLAELIRLHIRGYQAQEFFKLVDAAEISATQALTDTETSLTPTLTDTVTAAETSLTPTLTDTEIRGIMNNLLKQSLVVITSSGFVNGDFTRLSHAFEKHGHIHPLLNENSVNTLQLLKASDFIYPCRSIAQASMQAYDVLKKIEEVHLNAQTSVIAEGQEAAEISKERIVLNKAQQDLARQKQQFDELHKHYVEVTKKIINLDVEDGESALAREVIYQQLMPWLKQTEAYKALVRDLNIKQLAQAFANISDVFTTSQDCLIFIEKLAKQYTRIGENSEAEEFIVNIDAQSQELLKALQQGPSIDAQEDEVLDFRPKACFTTSSQSVMLTHKLRYARTGIKAGFRLDFLKDSCAIFIGLNISKHLVGDREESNISVGPLAEVKILDGALSIMYNGDITSWLIQDSDPSKTGAISFNLHACKAFHLLNVILAKYRRMKLS